MRSAFRMWSEARSGGHECCMEACGSPAQKGSHLVAKAKREKKHLCLETPEIPQSGVELCLGYIFGIPLHDLKMKSKKRRDNLRPKISLGIMCSEIKTNAYFKLESRSPVLSLVTFQISRAS